MFMRPSKEPADKLPGSDPYLDAAGGGPDVTRHLGMVATTVEMVAEEMVVEAAEIKFAPYSGNDRYSKGARRQN
jgi:hypothetical protein